MIEINGLTKSFVLSKEAKKQLLIERVDSRQHGDRFQALSDVNFVCEPGKVLGLLGPNGAGKTTTLRILASSLKPDSGEILVNGENIVKNPIIAKQKIGFLSSKTGLYNRLTAQENIEYFARLHGMQVDEIAEHGQRLYHELGIEPYLHRRVDTLSSGMLQKVSIARAVIHQPSVLVLDEPTTGLDIMATEAILSFIDSQKSLGRPVIFSTHHLDEVEALADNVAIINNGATAFSGTLQQLKQQTSHDELRKAFMTVITSDKNLTSTEVEHSSI